MEFIKRLLPRQWRKPRNNPSPDLTYDNCDNEIEYVDQKEIKNRLIERFGTDELHLEVLCEKIKLSKLKYAGSGAFSVVKRGYSLKYNAEVAVKIIRLDEEKNQSYVLKFLPSELEIWTELSVERNDNILNLLESFRNENLLYFVTEIAERGDLGQRLLGGAMTEHKAKSVFKQVVNAVSFCHNKGVAHRDIKADNLLLGNNDNIKLADFSLVTRKQTVADRCGTPGMLSPEQTSRSCYSPFKSDIWQLGVTLYQMLFKVSPYSEAKKTDLLREIEGLKNSFEGVPIPRNKSISPKCKELLASMLRTDPDARFDIKAIQNHDWLN